MNTKALREKRARLIEEARRIVEAGTKDGTALSAEDRAKVDQLRADAQALTDTIRIQEELEADERALVPESQRQAPPSRAGQATAAGEQRDAAVNAFLRFRETPEQRAMLAEIQPAFEGRAMNTITGAAGGFVVAPDTRFFGTIVEAQRAYGGMRQAGCTVVPTATGADLPIPTDDDTSNTGEIVAEEGSQSTATDVTIGQKILHAYLYSSKIIKVSWQLLNDASFPFEAWLARKLGVRLGRILNTHFTTGHGASRPQGVATGATVGRQGATGQTTSITADDIIRLIFSVDAAYRTGARFMAADSTILAISLLKDGDGQYLWRPGLTDGQPDRLRGYPIIPNNDVAAMAASASSLLFGDFSAYYIRDVQAIQVVRLNELYAANGQVGFLAYSRHDGGLIDAGQHPIKAYQNSAS